MEKNKTKPTPTFDSLTKFADYWDKHDTEDHPEVWREVEAVVKMPTRKYPRIQLDPVLVKQLERRARTTGVTLNVLVNDLLKHALEKA